MRGDKSSRSISQTGCSPLLGLHGSHPSSGGAHLPRARQPPPHARSHVGCLLGLTSSDRRRLTSCAWPMSFSFRFSTCRHTARVSSSLAPLLQPTPRPRPQPSPCSGGRPPLGLQVSDTWPVLTAFSPLSHRRTRQPGLSGGSGGNAAGVTPVPPGAHATGSSPGDTDPCQGLDLLLYL